MEKLRELFKKQKTKNTIIIILLVAILVESVVFIIVGATSKNTKTDSVHPPIELAVNVDGLSTELKASVSSALEGFTGAELNGKSISGLVKSVVYSDMITNTIMSIAYPLLYEILASLEMMDFATNIELYPTGPLFAQKMEGKPYTCCDKDGTRKPLSAVLQNVGSDWSYMDTKITWTDTDGTKKNTTLWNSIKWGITDKDSFYKAMADMSEGLRGVLEICIQSKSKVVTINVVDFILHTDALPINLDAATIYNSSPKSGYESCLVTLFNALGLKEGDYPDSATVCAYTNLGDIWKAILEPVLLAVEKAADDPINGLTSLLINFAEIIDNGSLVQGMKCMKMDGEFHELASAVMGFNNGELYNLGKSLVKIIGEMGLDIQGSFNSLLDGLVRKISGNEAIDLPDMDMTALKACAASETRNGGLTYYSADGEKAVNYLIDYAIDTKIVSFIIDLTPIKGTPEAQAIITAFGQSKDGIITITKTLAGMLINKLSSH